MSAGIKSLFAFWLGGAGNKISVSKHENQGRYAFVPITGVDSGKFSKTLISSIEANNNYSISALASTDSNKIGKLITGGANSKKLSIPAISYGNSEGYSSAAIASSNSILFSLPTTSCEYVNPSSYSKTTNILYDEFDSASHSEQIVVGERTCNPGPGILEVSNAGGINTEYGVVPLQYIGAINLNYDFYTSFSPTIKSRVARRKNRAIEYSLYFYNPLCNLMLYPFYLINYDFSISRLCVYNTESMERLYEFPAYYSGLSIIKIVLMESGNHTYIKNLSEEFKLIQVVDHGNNSVEVGVSGNNYMNKFYINSIRVYDL